MLDIKKVIKKKGYTVTSLAEKMDMKQVSLSRIINGNPTTDTLQKIADALDVDIRELFEPTKEGASDFDFTCPNCGVKLKVNKED